MHLRHSVVLWCMYVFAWLTLLILVYKQKELKIGNYKLVDQLKVSKAVISGCIKNFIDSYCKHVIIIIILCWTLWLIITNFENLMIHCDILFKVVKRRPNIVACIWAESRVENWCKQFYLFCVGISILFSNNRVLSFVVWFGAEIFNLSPSILA